jgi:hypothetical protein
VRPVIDLEASERHCERHTGVVLANHCGARAGGLLKRPSGEPSGDYHRTDWEYPVSHPSWLPAPCTLKHQVSEALDSSDAAARLNSISSGAAWKAVSGIGLAAGLSAKYQQFVVDEAVLDNGYAAAISGGPPTSLKGALSKLSTDCHKEGQTVRQ